MTNVEAGSYCFSWEEDWTDLPVSTGFAHHGLAVGPEGNLYSGDGAEPVIHVLDPSGALVRSFDVPVVEAHGLWIAEEDGDAVLWVVDTGKKADPPRNGPSQILKCTLTGEVLARVEGSAFGYAEGEALHLTACAVDTETGCLWVTDGYGASRIHRFGPTLQRELTLDGTESDAGAMRTPHWIWADNRQEHTRIYVADRGNDRILIYSTDGHLLRILDEGFRRPSGFAAFGDILVVAELSAGVVLLDHNDGIIGRLGDGLTYLDRPGWPNRKAADGTSVSPRDALAAGRFNSPHGIATDDEGTIYVSEWLYGDRHIRLRRQ